MGSRNSIVFADLPKPDEKQQDNLIRGSSCMRSGSASIGKRVIIYQRDWCGFLCQIIIPLVLVVFGLWLTTGPLKMK